MTKQEILSATDAFLFDLDGTLYLGDVPVEGAASTLEKLRGMDKKLVFLTNNSSKTEREYREKLARLGLFGKGDTVYTSGLATVEFLRTNYPKSRVYLLGTEALKEEFSMAGVHLTEGNPDVCILAYDTELTYEKLKKFDGYLRRGAVYLATHPDDVCPTSELPVPDAGAFIALFERSSGRRPDRIIGKPYRDLADGVSKVTGVERSKLCMVGDRMYTDIRFANNNGMMSILVLSGETTRETMRNFPDKPDLVLENINGLLK